MENTFKKYKHAWHWFWTSQYLPDTEPDSEKLMVGQTDHSILLALDSRLLRDHDQRLVGLAEHSEPGPRKLGPDTSLMKIENPEYRNNGLINRNIYIVR